MTKTQAKIIYDLKLEGTSQEIDRDILIRPFLSKKGWLIGPRGKLRFIWYVSHTSIVVHYITD